MLLVRLQDVKIETVFSFTCEIIEAVNTFKSQMGVQTQGIL